MSRTAGRSGLWRTVLLALAGACVLIWLAAWLAERHFQGPLERLLEQRARHPLRIAGRFEAHLLSAHPRVNAWDLEIGNPPWSGPGTLAHVGHVVIVFEWRFSTTPLAIRRLELDQSEWHLRRDPQDRANWRTRAEGPGAGLPLIRSLSIRAARVELDDRRRHVRFNGVVSAGDEGAGEAPPLRLQATGELNGRPAAVRIDGEPLATARRGQAWHFSLEEQSGDSHLSARGYLLQPFDFRELEGSFEAAGPTLHDGYYLIGVKLPETRPFAVSGHLSRRGRRFTYRELHVSSGESDLSGVLTVERAAAGPSHMTAELTSRHLRLSDLGARRSESQGMQAQSGTPAQGDTPSQGGMLSKGAGALPDKPLRLTGLRRSEAHVVYGAQQLDIGRQSLYEVSGTVDTHAGTLRIEGLRAHLAGGELTGDALLDASGDEAETGLKLRVQGLQVEQLLGALHPPAMASGKLDGRLELASHGDSWRALADGARGEATFVIPRGTVRASVAKLASADIAGALGLLSHSAKETPIRCGVAGFEAGEGALRIRTLLLDTDAALLTGSGQLNLDTSALDVTIRGRPKHPTLALHSGIKVSGPIRQPNVAVQKRAALIQGGAAIALGAALSPLAAALAFVDPSLKRDADCEPLLREASADPAHEDPAHKDAVHEPPPN